MNICFIAPHKQNHAKKKQSTPPIKVMLNTKNTVYGVQRT